MERFTSQVETFANETTKFVKKIRCLMAFQFKILMEKNLEIECFP